MQTYNYPNYIQYHNDVISHRSTVKGIITAMNEGRSNGKSLRIGMAFLVREWVVMNERQVQRLTIYLEKGKSFVNATMLDGVFTSVSLITPACGMKAQTPAEIAALPVFAELCELWQIAREKQLIR